MGDSMLKNLIILLGLSEHVSAQMEAKLNLIISGATARLKLLLGGVTPPEEMNHIILDVSAARFNRIGSEGLTGHTVEGESLSFSSNDFSQFDDEIQAYLEVNKGISRGKVRFL